MIKIELIITKGWLQKVAVGIIMMEKDGVRKKRGKM